MTAPLLSDLREPPIVGRYYMVPVVEAREWAGLSGLVPVFGPRHTDADHFAFPDPHYHVDIRFLTAREYRRISYSNYRSWSPEMVVAGLPLSNARSGGVAKGRPALARKRCARPQPEYAAAREPAIQRFRDAVGIGEAIVLKDGRKLCPHRRVDISAIPADADGLTTCPLHGMRVRCAA